MLRVDCPTTPVIERCRTETHKAQKLCSISGQVREPPQFEGTLLVDSSGSPCVARRVASIPMAARRNNLRPSTLVLRRTRNGLSIGLSPTLSR